MSFHSFVIIVSNSAGMFITSKAGVGQKAKPPLLKGGGLCRYFQLHQLPGVSGIANS
jgi:hypothetical protein